MQRERTQIRESTELGADPRVFKVQRAEVTTLEGSRSLGATRGDTL